LIEKWFFKCTKIIQYLKYSSHCSIQLKCNKKSLYEHLHDGAIKQRHTINFMFFLNLVTKVNSNKMETFHVRREKLMATFTRQNHCVVVFLRGGECSQ